MTAALAPGTRFGGYRIVRLLGEGGMGAVHEGVHDGLQKRVAIKTLHPSVVTSPEAVERFVREGRAASRIRHPNVVDVTDVGVENGTPYLVMEFLDGVPLSSFVERNGPMPLDVLLDVALPVIDALAAAHDEGVVHRDIKPDNVFLVRTRSGELHPTLLDFGISKVDGASPTDARLTKTTAMMGTPYYMSPEQARGAKHVDARSDEFSFALVLHEMATGKRPIQGDSLLEVIHKISTVDIPKLGQVRPDLPPAFVAVVERALSLDPTRRHGSMRALGAALLPFAGPRTRAVWERSFVGLAAPPSMAPGPMGHVATPTPMAGAPTPFVSSVPPRARPSGSRGLFLVLGIGVGGLAILGVAGLVVTVLVTSMTGGGASQPAAAPVVPAAVTPPPPPPPFVLPPSRPEPLPPPVAAEAEPEHPVAPAHVARPAHPPPEAPLPAVPPRQDIVRIMQSMQRPVAACFGDQHGIVRVSMVVSGDTGRVAAITIARPFAGTPVEMCVAEALHGARFPRFTAPTFTVAYPFRI